MVTKPIWPNGRFGVPQITPYTYRDGHTLLELITSLRDHVVNQLHPNLQQAIDQLVADVETEYEKSLDRYVDGVQEFQRIHDAFMSDVNAHLIALNDGAVSDLVADETSLLGKLLREIFLPKTRERVHVVDYGAQGDGVTDDTQAIRDAITATPPGGTLVFSEGDYLIGNADYFHGPREMFRITGDMTIMGNGAHIIDHSGYNTDRTLFSVQGSNVTIDGLKISNQTPNADRPVHRAIGVGSPHGIEQYQHIRNVAIRNCEIRQSFYAIQVRSNNTYSIQDVKITGNTVYGIPGQRCGGIMLQSTDDAPLGNVHDVIVANNHVYDVSTAAAIGVFGTYNVSVTGNYCNGSEDIGAGIQTERGSHNVSITGNTLLNHHQAVWIHDTSNATVTGNNISNPENRHGDKAYGVRITIQGTPVHQPYVSRGIVVSGNTIQDAYIMGTVFSTVDHADTRIESLVITGNTIRINNRSDYGIHLTRRVINAVVQGNYVDGAKTASIYLTGSAAHVGKPGAVITGNITTGAGYGLDGNLIAYLGEIHHSGNRHDNGVNPAMLFQHTIGDRKIIVTDEANRQAPEGTLLLGRNNKSYVKTGSYNTSWTELGA